MDWPEIIGTIISAIILGSFFFIAGEGTAAPQERTSEGTIFLRANKIYYYFGIFSCALVFIAILVTLYYDPSQLLIAFFTTFLCFGIPGLSLVLFYKNCWLEFDENIINSGTFFGQSKTINWDEVENISFGYISKFIKIKSGSELIKVHYHMEGLVEFLKMIEKRTDTKVADLKIPL